MERLASTAFQKAYAHLRTPVQVTVHGRVIGTWFPTGLEPAMGRAKATVPPVPDVPDPKPGPGPRGSEKLRPAPPIRPFGESHPAPKPTSKKR